ncbi:cysteine-rich repeat secretory protein 3-like [Olea europaea var. sylvestris]|uniref:cysteine-rich repeat secretory protein 3-like n=1 Tax=Olea europaea var. sylvestris TaxID=158386 RepID=UPI000C1D4E9C|nr:cysteine-rich repeat secretory protein 3-like [Olea europaea var. sylvestris]
MEPFQSLLLLLILLIPAVFSTVGSSSDYNDLVYKGCANQDFQDFDGIYKQTLKNLFDTLISQSSTTKFYKATSGDGQSAINGLSQCRGDLSNSDCVNCVKKASEMSEKLCGHAIAVRVQLNGCYLRYEIAGFRQGSVTELLYKVCGSTQASGAGFDDRLNSALDEITKSVGSGNSGFYTGEYESVYVLGQCEGDLSSGDCVNCVKNAIDRAKSECGTSISAQIYLQECYISYTYYPSGVPTNTSPSFLSGSVGTRKNTQKTVAIILGGAAGIGLGIACLLFTKSTFWKKTNPYKYGG